MIAHPDRAGQSAAHTAWHVVTATSITLLVAGQLGVLLSLGEWATAHLLGLPEMLTTVVLVITGLVSAAVAVVIFIRVMRIEARLAAKQSIDDVGWHPFNPDRN